LSLTLWQGSFEKTESLWLRWCDAAGNLIPTGAERADRAEAEVERLRAELARLKRSSSRKRAK
jgi:hypothetical protein